MDSKLIAACLGKSKSQGGLNMPDLVILAEQQGHNTRGLSRAELLQLLCNKKQAIEVVPAPHQPKHPGARSVDVMEYLAMPPAVPVVGQRLKSSVAQRVPIIAVPVPVPEIKEVIPTLVEAGKVVQVGQRKQDLESNLLSNACQGKIKNEGGLDKDQLLTIAKEKKFQIAKK